MFKKILTSPFFIFPAISCIVLWPLSLQFFTLKNDALTYYYPIRTLISDALNNGELPLWTPFINMGYPVHADMQSGAWNPVIWIFSFLTQYSLAAFHFELLFYIGCAGIGFYFLCKDLGCTRTVAYSMAFSYQFSGFMVDSVQFFTCISSACYLPFIFLFFRRMICVGRTQNALATALFLYLMFTGGYPALFIITAYLLLSYTLFYSFFSSEKKRFAKRFLPMAMLSLICFTLLSLPAIISFIEYMPHINRGKGQLLTTILENSMNPTTSLSLLTPFGITANEAWLNSSILMRNIYVGILPLTFMITAFYNQTLRNNKEVRFFFFFAVICLGMAWGSFFFLRQWAYYVLPLMNSFRHPALFRLFSIFFTVIIAALAFNAWAMKLGVEQTIFKRVLRCILIVAIVVAILSLISLAEPNIFTNHVIANIKSTFTSLSFSERYLLQFPFILSVIVLSIQFLKNNTRLLAVLILADMAMATQFNLPITIIGAKTFEEVNELLQRNPEKFPLPGSRSIHENSLNSLDELSLTGSKIPFSKRFGRNSYFITPGNLSTQEQFYKSPIRNIVFENAALYFPDTVIAGTATLYIGSYKLAFHDEGTSIPMVGKSTDKDSIFIDNFSSNSIVATIEKKFRGLLVYQQNNYKGWIATVDGEETKILSVNISSMAINVPPGKHKIMFQYRPQHIVYAWYLSVFCLLICFTILSFPFFSKYSARKRLPEMTSIRAKWTR